MSDAGILRSKLSKARVAIVQDIQSEWATEHTATPTQHIREWTEPLDWFAAFANRGVTADVTPIHAQWDTYDAVVIPCVYLFSEETAERLRTFVRNGGKAFVTYYSALADEHDRLYTEGWPGLIGDVVGVRIEEHCPLGTLFPGMLDHLDVSNGTVVHDLADVIDAIADDTTVLATFEADPATGMDGRAAITVHPYHEGGVAYIAGKLGRDGISQSLPEICAALGFELDADPRAGDVLRVVREQEDGAIFEFLFNRTRNTVTADRPAGDMLICSLKNGQHRQGHPRAKRRSGVQALNSPTPSHTEAEHPQPNITMMQ